MKVQVNKGDTANYATELLVVNLFKGVKTPGGATGAVDKALEGTISASIKAGEIEGKLGQTLILHTFDKIPAKRVLVVGLGRRDKFGPDQARCAAAKAVWEAEKHSVKDMATIIHGAGIGGMEAAAAAEHTVLGSLLAAYRFDVYKSEKEKKKPRVRTLTVLELDEAKLAAFKTGASSAEAIAFAQNFARDLVNEPSNVLTPIEFAARVSEVAVDAGTEVEVFDEAWIQKKGMNLLWGVAKGSVHQPRLVVIRHRGGTDKDPWIALIGKGVMFDSGGISIKGSNGMESMKGDMGGGAAVVGAMVAAAKLGLKRNVMALIPAVVNSPDGAAQNPGDIVQSFDGPSVEIISTDAEGRLVMADALSYARELGASYLVDIATLTGACVVALGTKVAALFSTDEKMQKLFIRNVEITGEKLWPMPMFEEYADQLKSTAAQIKNTGGRPAGSITAAKFLEHFTDKKPWCHIDIASKESTKEPYGCYRKGATGFGVRTLLRFIEQWSG